MSRAALISVITLIKALKVQFPNINVVGGHNEWKNNVGERSCPGEYGLGFVKALRTELGIKSLKKWDMIKKKKIAFSVIIVLIILKLFGGIYEDDEFEEKYFFIKNKPSFKTYFYSPRGMSDMTIEQMS